MKSLRFALSICALGAGSMFALGCGSSVQTCPFKGGTPWHEVTSRHFVLQTDLAEAEARATGDDLERLYTLLDSVVFRGYRGAIDRVNVVLFADGDAIDAFTTKPLAGWYQEQSSIDLERAPTIVMRGGLGRGASSVFLHELTHRLMYRTFGYIPTWFNEGFAQYFSTARLQDGRVVLGEPVSGTHINASFVPEVDDLVTASRDRFYGHDSYRYYEGAWSLAHFLQNGTLVKSDFDVFVAAINGGARIELAWAQFEASVGKEQLQKAFRDYLDQSTWQSHWQAITVPRASIVERVRAMGDDEVHIRWARLFDDANDDAIRTQLELATTHASDSAEARYWRGTLALAQKNYAAAESTFRAARAILPDEPRNTYGLLVALEHEDNANGAELEALAKSLREHGTTPDELNGAARVFLRAKNAEEADALVTRSLAIDPGYWRSLVTVARVRFAEGRAADAMEAQEKGISHAPEGAVVSMLTSDLARYAAAAAAQKRNDNPPR